MASIIKNQIIKHLSAFARNLTPDQISVEVLRGKGELRNVELNEQVLTERLELPAWIKICHARCNRVVVKVPWTRIKSSAVELHIDEIEVIIRLSADVPSTYKKPVSVQASKTYDLAERIIEGLALYVQTVVVQFESDCFGGSLMFSRLHVESKSPLFKNEKDLHMTRIHDKNLHQLIFFKQVSWQLFKIEASALKNVNNEEKYSGLKRKNALNSPLRLITTGEGKYCAVIGGRIEVFLEEILWVATLLQVRSAIEFYKHIINLAKAAKQNVDVNPFLIDLQPKASSVPQFIEISSTLEAFKIYDFPRSSHHLQISKIDLHLFDDSSAESLPNDWDINNGAIQATLHKLRVDFYPSHLVFTNNGKFSNRFDWVSYSPFNSCTELAKKQLSHYLDKLSKNMDPSLQIRFESMRPYLSSKNVVIRIEDIVVQCVSDQNSKRDSLQHMFIQKKSFVNTPNVPLAPSVISFFHLEFTSYYFLASHAYPLPPDSTHLVIGPFEFLIDYRSLRWIIYVFENILNAFDTFLGAEKSCTYQLNFRADFLEPKIILMAPELTNDLRLPKRFLINAKDVYVSNFTVPQSSCYANNENDYKYDFLQEFISQKELVFNCLNFLNSNLFADDLKFLQFLNWEKLLQKIKKLAKEDFDENCSIDAIYRPIDDICFCISLLEVTMSSDFGINTYVSPIVSNTTFFITLALQLPVNVMLVKAINDIDAVLDHFQFVRFLQLHTSVIDFISLIEADRKFFSDINKQFLSSEKTLLNEPLPLILFFDIEKIKIHLVLPTGPIPSPYDKNWINSTLMRNSQTTLSSGPSNEELIDTIHELACNSGVVVNKFSNRDDYAYSYKLDNVKVEDFSNIESFVPHNIDIQSKEITSVGKNFICANFSATSLNSEELEFSNRMSNIEDTMSLTTTTYDYDQELCMLTVNEDNELSAENEVKTAATNFIDKKEHWKRIERNFFGRIVNVLDVTVCLTHIFVGFGLINNESDRSSMTDKTTNETKNNFFELIHSSFFKTVILGFANSFNIKERFKQICGDVYKKYDVVNQSTEKNVGEEKNKTFFQNGAIPNALFKINISKKNETIIQAYLDGKGEVICLSDEIVSQLSPFVENTELNVEPPNPPQLKLKLNNLRIEVQSSRKRHPLRIHVNSILTIGDGPNFL